MTTTAYVIKFEGREISQSVVEHVLTANNHFLGHVYFRIHELWKDPGPDARTKWVTTDEEHEE